MDFRAKDQSEHSRSQGRLIDFAPASTNSKTARQKINDSAASPKAPTPPPAPVTSAKDAINAMYAKRPLKISTPTKLSAREAVNAVASQATTKPPKTASSLHHGSLQRNLESTRTSASAILKTAPKNPPEISRFQAISSADPLAKVPSPSANKKPSISNRDNAPVVHTSLKLGNNVRPRPAPVVLPPNARMAQAARPVHKTRAASPLIQDAQGIINRSSGIQPKLQPSVDAFSAAKVTEAEIEVNIAPSPSASPKNPPADKSISQKNTSPSPRKPQPTKPQFTQDIRRAAPAPAAPASRPAQPNPENMAIHGQAPLASAAIDHQMGQPAHFRSAPKGFATNTPQPLATDGAYVMAEPPKLHPRAHVPAEEVNFAENFYSNQPPQPSLGNQAPQSVASQAGDRAPIGRIVEQQVASGHGYAASAINADLPGIQSENTSNYSFSRPKEEPPKKAPKLGEKSPFIRSVNVDKRPLSDNTSAPSPNRLARQTEEKPSRKNLYTKKSSDKPEKKFRPRTAQPLPTRPTVIIPTGHRSKAPLFFLVMLTVILGAAVGAAAYLCFFQ